MQFEEKEFLPVLLGNDINVYSMARAFYEEYKVKSKVFGKATISTCYKSKLVDFTEVKNLDTDDILVKTVNTFVKENKNKKIILIGCGDSYVSCITKNRSKLNKDIIIPYSEHKLLNNIMDKSFFYDLCEKHNIPYPKTRVISINDYKDLKLNFKAPYVVKPSNQIEYYINKFEGQEKVFILDTDKELKTTLEAIYTSGYKDKLILQEFIPGDDTNMYVLTSYSDKNNKVKMMCLGHVLLEEHTPYGIGNHAVIITEKNKKLCETMKKLYEDLNYTGFSNCDIKYDPRDKKYKVFEMNVRQGRSNYYVTGSGCNIAKIIVDEYVYGKEIKMNICDKSNLWLVVPKEVAFKYAPAYKDKMKKLIASKNFVNPLYFKEDNDPIRLARLYKSQLTHFANFKKYTKKR